MAATAAAMTEVVTDTMIEIDEMEVMEIVTVHGRINEMTDAEITVNELPNIIFY